MRPANQQQAIRHMNHLLKCKLKGNRQASVKEHLNRARRIAVAIWGRFQVGPYQYQLKHLGWYIEVYTKDLKPSTRYRYRLTIIHIDRALNLNTEWANFLRVRGGDSGR